MKTKLEIITPERARKWLELNERNPRRHFLSGSRVKVYAAAIRRGEWVVTHQGIAFDKDGFLVDGQHRLHAICVADTAVPCQVTRDLPPNAVGEIDRGKARSMAVVQGITNRLVSEPLGYLTRLLYGSNPSSAQIRLVVEKLGPAAERLAQRATHKKARVSAAPVRAGFLVHYLRTGDEGLPLVLHKFIILSVTNTEELQLPTALRTLHQKLTEGSSIDKENSFAWTLAALGNPSMKRFSGIDPVATAALVREELRAKYNL